MVEALIFASGDSLSLRQITKVVSGASAAEVKAALIALRKEYEGRGCRLAEVAGGWQFRTAPEHHGYVKQLFKERPFRLTRAGIETLSIVAYKQPATRAEVEMVRGVDSSGVLESLVERRLVRIAGRRDVPGRPLVYVTTPVFLETFGLRDIKSLPTLAELGEEIQSVADASGFAERGEEAAARVIPLEEDGDRGDDQEEGIPKINFEGGEQAAEREADSDDVAGQGSEQEDREHEGEARS